MNAGSEPTVLLAGGLAVPTAALSLLLSLEARGFQLSRDGDDLMVTPGGRLSEQDRVQIRGWKRHLLALVQYQAPMVPQ
jgi:hypothetical protein